MVSFPRHSVCLHLIICTYFSFFLIFSTSSHCIFSYTYIWHREVLFIHMHDSAISKSKHLFGRCHHILNLLGF